MARIGPRAYGLYRGCMRLHDDFGRGGNEVMTTFKHLRTPEGFARPQAVTI